jgi:hypothetical protein
VIEKFVKQLDGCTYVSGGLSCTAASEAMWLYRASQGKISTTACAVRKLTGDTDGGLMLPQVEAVSRNHYGITSGIVYRPMKFTDLVALLRAGHGAIIQGGYSVLRGTKYDCFKGNFGGGHAIYASYANSTIIHAGDPGADGRYSGCPSGFQNYPISLLQQFADRLPLGRLTLAQDRGPGYVYAYVTPKDPVVYRYTIGTYNLRSGAGTSHSIVETMPANTKLLVLGTAKDSAGRLWYRVRDTRNSKTGYVIYFGTRS